MDDLILQKDCQGQVGDPPLAEDIPQIVDNPIRRLHPVFPTCIRQLQEFRLLLKRHFALLLFPQPLRQGW
ncbi:hypothetical protein QC763_0022780 [Podospora pseudopauciseta]|uniref:Uncharacterized protein n=2 Tax=Podospora TaxID=5144 RepID=A0ABR0I1N9_9PEZI|nr:hypothetical protein QC763_0022780 [Podospora pseudopauciseta]KAK4682779.1 hypothetical protein QC764_0022700 [Podospora pseudoanserina]